MKKLALIGLLLCGGCGGSIPEEQRQKYKEGMEQQKIVRITDAEIMTAALSKGNKVFKALHDKAYNPGQLDSIARVHGAKVRFSIPGTANALAIEQELIEAYVAGITEGNDQENLQKIYTTGRRDVYDSLLYSKPQLKMLPDGTEVLEGIWNIYLDKKSIILEISKSK